MNRTRSSFSGLALLLASGTILVAQSLETGALTGTVRDTAGKPLAAVQIDAASGQTRRTAVTDAQGRYRLNLLGLGRWSMTVHAPSYQTASARVVLGINETQAVNFKLQPLAGATVEVLAKPEDINQASTQISSNFSSEALAGLPADFSSVTPLDAILATVPGVQSNGNNNFQFYGGTGDQNLFVVDGNITNSTKANSAQNGVSGLPPREFMESIEVVTGGFGAEYNVLGGVINMATKSGSNHWVGELFWYTNFPNSSAKVLYNANAGQGLPNPVTTNTRYGATLGGPIIKDKVFFFLGVQGTKSVTPPAGVAGANWNGFVSSPSTQNGPNTLSAKVNWIINTDHELVLATTNVRSSFDTGSSYPSSSWKATGSADTGGHGYSENQTTNLTWNWTVNPNLFLVTSVGNHTDPNHQFSNKPLVNDTAVSFFDYQYFLTGPGANAPNKPDGYEFYDYIGGTTATPIASSNPNRQFRADLTWTPANHTVRAGYSLQRARVDSSTSRTSVYSIFSIYNSWGFTGDPTDLQLYQNEGIRISQQGTYAGIYVKDLWEVAPGLRIDYGLRFDSIRFVGNNPPISGQQLLNFSNFRRQMQPRLGIAWDVHRDGRTKLYANFGRFFETMPLQSFDWASTSLTSLYYWNASTWTYNPNYTDTQVPYAIKTNPATGLPYAPYVSYDLGSTSQNPPMANDLRLPHKDVLLLGGDQVLPGGWTVGANWRWWKLKDPITLSMFSNPDGSNAFPGEVGSSVIWNPHPGPVTFTNGDGKVLTWDSPFPDPKEVFIALNLHARYQGSLGFLAANYTWTHHYGNYRGLSIASTAQAANNNAWAGSANTTSDWFYYQTINSGNNEANPVHEFKLTGEFAVPVAGQKLNVGAVFTWQSGYGLTATIPVSNVLHNAFLGGYMNTSSNGIMSNYGHTPSISNLDLNLNMALKFGPLTVTPSVAISNVFNTRSTTAIDTVKELGHYDNVDHPVSPYFGLPIGWQPGRAITAGLSVQF